MGFVAAVGAKQKPAAVVQPGEGAFDDPAFTPEAGALRGLASGDHGERLRLQTTSVVGDKTDHQPVRIS